MKNIDVYDNATILEMNINSFPILLVETDLDNNNIKRIKVVHYVESTADTFQKFEYYIIFEKHISSMVLFMEKISIIKYHLDESSDTGIEPVFKYIYFNTKTDPIVNNELIIKMDEYIKYKSIGEYVSYELPLILNRLQEVQAVI